MSASGESRALLRELFDAALERVDAGRAVRGAVRPTPRGLELSGEALPPDARLVVLAVGKAALAMASAVAIQAGNRVAAGLIVTKDGHAGGSAPWPVHEAGHPVPDARSVEAAEAVLERVARAGREDVLLVLLSGGASAVLTAPLPGLTLDDLAATTSALLAAGADIDELNTVRKHLTRLSGGRLARAAHCRRIVVLAISDVPGDDPSLIGSGPCAPDPSRYADALAVLERHALGARVPAAVRAFLEAGVSGAVEESLKPGDAAVARVRTQILASNRDAIEAAAVAARGRGCEVQVLPEELRGEARVAGRRLAGFARALAPGPPRILLAGGETTVTVHGKGRGGRSQELALAAALALEGDRRVTLLAVGTDGEDGPTPAAGAFADGGTVARGRAAGVEARDALTDNDAHGFFAREGGLLTTGPTGTNVRDLVLIHRT